MAFRKEGQGSGQARRAVGATKESRLATVASGYDYSLSGTARFLCCLAAFLAGLLSAASAQDIRGLEICTAEKQMERRTGCLQANVEFLQQALTKLAKEMRDKAAIADRSLSAAQAEIAELKSTVAKLNAELTQMKANAEPSSKK